MPAGAKLLGATDEVEVGVVVGRVEHPLEAGAGGIGTVALLTRRMGISGFAAVPIGNPWPGVWKIAFCLAARLTKREI